MDAWLGVLAPKNTPPNMANRLSEEFLAIMTTNEVKDSLFKKGIIASPSGPREMAELLQKDLVRWQQVVKRAGINPD